MITATQSALDKMTSLRVQLQMPYGLLKIGLQGGGCSGFTYSIEFTDKLTDSDKMFIVSDEPEETVLIDKRSYKILDGMEIDYVNDADNGGFRFKVPGAKSCGCGMSFGPID